MKKTIGICLFTVIWIFLCVGGLMLYDAHTQSRPEERKIAEVTEAENETEIEPLAESMQVQETYRYLLAEENGVLVVYEKDGKTVVLETNIRLHDLTEETRLLLQKGIKITDEQELYDFLESYSS